MDKKLKLLHKLYTNTKYPAAFAGIDSLYNEAKKHDPTIEKKMLFIIWKVIEHIHYTDQEEYILKEVVQFLLVL